MATPAAPVSDRCAPTRRRDDRRAEHRRLGNGGRLVFLLEALSASGIEPSG